MTSTEAEEGATNSPARSTSAIALFKLAFPVAGLILGALYVESTYGEIRLSNLYYPYFVIGVLALLTVTVLVDEFRELRAWSGELGFVESVTTTADEWRRSIGFTIIAVAYIALIEPIGFFIATAFGMVGIMLVGGRRDPLWISVVTGIIVVFVYIMFIQIMGLRPPTGPLGL